MAHAKISPSALHRTLVCTRSVTASASIPSTTSVYAEEGTLAHKVGELKILLGAGMMLKKAYEKEMTKLKKDSLYSVSLDSYMDDYATFVLTAFNEARATDPTAKLLVEQVVDLTDWIPEGFGTADVVIVSDSVLHVIDLKYGKGELVEALNNPQQMAYAVGSVKRFNKMYEFEIVKSTIYQPRLNHFDTAEYTTGYLNIWAASIKDKVKEAWDGTGEFVPGSHCKFCPFKPQCAALCAFMEEEFKPTLLPGSITVEQIDRVLENAALMRDWLKAVEDHALALALSGQKFKGFKLIESETKRKYIEEKKGILFTHLQKLGFDPKDFTKTSIIGITDLTELLKTKKIKFDETFTNFVVKPKGGPSLVPLKSKGKDWVFAEQAFADMPDTVDDAVAVKTQHFENLPDTEQ